MNSETVNEVLKAEQYDQTEQFWDEQIQRTIFADGEPFNPERFLQRGDLP
jgi:hypothetical protein